MLNDFQLKEAINKLTISDFDTNVKKTSDFINEILMTVDIMAINSNWTKSNLIGKVSLIIRLTDFIWNKFTQFVDLDQQTQTDNISAIVLLIWNNIKEKYKLNLPYYLWPVESLLIKTIIQSTVSYLHSKNNV